MLGEPWRGWHQWQKDLQWPGMPADPAPQTPFLASRPSRPWAKV